MSNIDTAALFTTPDYLSVDPTVAADRKAFLRTVWNAIAPELELQYGIYNSTVAAPAALFSQALIESVDRWRQHTQVAQLIEGVSEGTIDYEYLELFLENYRIKRKEGVRSVGLVRLVFTSDAAYTFAAGDTFTARGLIFRPTVQVNISPTGRTVYAPNDTVLQKLDDNTYTAVLELESELVTPSANLTVGTKLVMTNRSYAALIDTTVIDTFVGGVIEDRLQDLVPQLVNGITSPVLSSRAHIAAQLKSLETVTLRDVSVIGAGDIESVRDKHGLFGISHGGRGDVYVRTSDILMGSRITKTCEREAGTNIFRCALSPEDAPAAYSVVSIMRKDGSASLPVVGETRGIDLGDGKYAPDVVNYQEGAFSAFQTILVRFEDDKASGDTDEYYVSYDYQPGIKELQDYCSDEANVSVMGDLLVKAAIPCKVTLDFSVVIQKGQSAPDLVAAAASAVTAINSTGFMNVLPGAVVIESVQRLLPAGMFVSDFMMTGDAYVPELVEGEGQVVRLRKTAAAAKEELAFKIPPYVTENTVCFFADINNVHITVKTYESMAN